MDTRQKRCRHFGVRGDVKASVDGGEEGSLPFERSAAICTSGEMRAQLILRFSAAGRSYVQRVFIMFAWHRNFSANCLRA